MKALPFLLIPSVAVLVSACASGPAGPGYGGSPGYYGHDTVYVQGRDSGRPDYNDSQSTRNVTNVNEVNVNRTTANSTDISRTNVQKTAEVRGKQTTAKAKTTRKPAPKSENPLQGNQQGVAQGNQ